MGRHDREFAEGWKPNPGDEITGVVQSLSEREGKWGMYPIATVLVAEGPEGEEELTGDRIAVHANAKAISEEFEKQKIAVGDLLACKYLGQRESKTGNKYAAFSTVIEKDHHLKGAVAEAEAKAEAAEAAQEEPF